MNIMKFSLYFQLWMTLALTSSEFGAMRISNEQGSRKHPKSTLKQLRPRISNPMQNDFPYRYVFTSNHPFSAFAQFLTAHPTTPTASSHNYDIYATSATAQQYHSNQMPEYKYLFKSPPPPSPPRHYQQQTAQPYPSANPIPVSPLPFHPTPSPVILLLHAGQPGTGPFQTFVLIPADSNGIPLAPNPTYPNPVHTIQIATNPPYSIPVRPNVLPLTPATIPSSPVLTHSSQYLKPTSNHYQTQISSQLLQRPVNIYQMPATKYFPQKKSSSIESKISSVDNDKSETRTVSTSTERSSEKHNMGNRYATLNSTVE